MALPCGHVFHQECIEKYADCKGCSIETACVFRCLQVQQVEPAEIDSSQASAAGVASSPRQDSPAADQLDADLEALISEADQGAQELHGSGSD